MLGDVDEHQADQDLVGVEAVAQQRDDRRPDHAAEHAGDAGSAATIQSPVSLPACIATPLAKIAPRMNCPSAPMFQTLERKHTARPSAISSSGVAFTASSVQRVDALHRLDEEHLQAAQRILAEEHEQAGADHAP